jgi:glycosyltransferase involved in cell wall biosynthesis
VINFPVYGGPHNRAARMAKSLESRGWRLVVIMPDEAGNAAGRLREAGVEVVTLPLSRVRASLNPRKHLALIGSLAPDVRRLRGLIRQMNADVVLVNGLANPHGAIAANLEGRPVVWQILDTRTPPPIREGLMLVVRQLADVLMVTGQRVADMHFGASAFSDRLVKFFPPVDTDLFRLTAEQRLRARQQLGFTDDEFVVGTVGNMNPQKRYGHFVRAAACLRKDVPKARFVILGAIPSNHSKYVRSVENEAHQLGLNIGRDLILLDPESQVHQLACAFDAFWLTAGRRSEGISTAVEEAMALGIPVVSTDVGSMREAVDAGETGFIVPPNDIAALATATVRLAQDPELRQRMSARSRDVAVHRFGVAACVDAHVRAFDLAMAYAWKVT